MGLSRRQETQPVSIAPKPYVALGLLSLSLLTAPGCCDLCSSYLPREPMTARGHAMAGRAMNAREARAILAQLPARDLRNLEQLMFIIDLRRAKGNEQHVARLYWRTRRMLAQPVALNQTTASEIIQHMARFVAEMGQVKGYKYVSRMLSPIFGGIPRESECYDKILTYPPQVALAFLYREYFSGTHYHSYVFRRALINQVLRNFAADRALGIYAHFLRSGYPSSSATSHFSRIIRVVRPLLGADFGAWYKRARGRSYPK